MSQPQINIFLKLIQKNLLKNITIKSKSLVRKDLVFKKEDKNCNILHFLIKNIFYYKKIIIFWFYSYFFSLPHLYSNLKFYFVKILIKAAQELNINYSSAKTILHIYRKKAKKLNFSNNSLPIGENIRCGSKLLSSSSSFNKMEVITSQGGHITCNIFLAPSFQYVSVTQKTQIYVLESYFNESTHHL